MHIIGSAYFARMVLNELRKFCDPTCNPVAFLAQPICTFERGVILVCLKSFTAVFRIWIYGPSATCIGGIQNFGILCPQGRPMPLNQLFANWTWTGAPSTCGIKGLWHHPKHWPCGILTYISLSRCPESLWSYHRGLTIRGSIVVQILPKLSTLEHEGWFSPMKLKERAKRFP